MKNNTYKIALFGVLSAVALTLSYLEGLIPTVAFMPPGAKMGFSNIATMFAASSMGIVSALAITFIKALFAGITRGVTAFFMSLCGGILSTVTMYLLFKLSKKTGYMAIGIICALVHNFGQLIVAIITAGNLSVLVLHGQCGQRGDLVRQRAALQAGRGGLLGGIVHGLYVAQQFAVHLVFHKHKDLGVNALAAHPLDLLL